MANDIALSTQGHRIRIDADQNAASVANHGIERMKLFEELVQLNHCQVHANVRVGYRSYANDTMIRSYTTIGRYCSIGRRCTINAASHPAHWLSSHSLLLDPSFNPAATDFQPQKELEIGNDVWIGDNVVIMGGISIGDGAIIGAGAVVTKDIPAYTIHGGVPAKLIRQRFDSRIAEELLDIRWWDFEESLLLNLPFADLPACIETMRERIASGQAKVLPPHHRPK